MVGPINIREILDAYQTRKWVEIGFEFECVRCQSVGFRKPAVKQWLREHRSAILAHCNIKVKEKVGGSHPPSSSDHWKHTTTHH